MALLRILRLRLQLASTHALIWAATFGRDGELRPEAHFALADLHFRLSDAYQAAGRWLPARRHRVIANRHAAAGPPPPTRPAAAMAMPLPRPYTYTDARGIIIDPPDGVA